MDHLIVRTYRIEVTEYADLTFPDTDIVAVVRITLDGEFLEPLVVRCDEHAELTVCAQVTVVLADGRTVALAEEFGGSRFLSLAPHVRARVIDVVLSQHLNQPTEAHS